MTKPFSCPRTRTHPEGMPQLPFRCRGCKRRRCGWCQGADDNLPFHCNDCWAKAERMKKAKP